MIRNSPTTKEHLYYLDFSFNEHLTLAMQKALLHVNTLKTHCNSMCMRTQLKLPMRTGIVVQTSPYGFHDFSIQLVLYIKISFCLYSFHKWQCKLFFPTASRSHSLAVQLEVVTVIFVAIVTIENPI